MRSLSSLERACKNALSLNAYGIFTRALFGADVPPEIMRARFERFGRASRTSLRRKHPGIVFDEFAIGPLTMESTCAVEKPRCAVLHLHGGAFLFGSSASYRRRAMRMSFRLEAEVFVPDYRLAPEHPYPAALDDALVAYQYVRALRPGVPLLLSGDSAGGGLALGLLLRLRGLGEPMPNGAILLSPWTDLSVSGASVDSNRTRDRWLSREHLNRWAAYYVQDGDRRDPGRSPLFAELSGLPPLLLVVGEDEVLLDDAARLATVVADAGGDSRLVVGRGMQHDYPLTLPWLEESRRAWDAMVAFAIERRDAGRRSDSERLEGGV